MAGPCSRRAVGLPNERSSERKVTCLSGRNQAVGFDRSDSEGCVTQWVVKWTSQP